ncbi:hypothetical protein SO3561_09074 [Streptomyces olivochromogenes]|uniref:Uncharacterized protein n=2 Tax=Streptomyces olivochromogenes TaxID=1963 RepID=A0A250VTR6_STROL|nr:hypothetical protein SO3561_09074 [Streptomyces olivochromogenes]
MPLRRCAWPAATRAVVLDVTDQATARAAAQQIGERFGHLDVLINIVNVSSAAGSLTITSDPNGPLSALPTSAAYIERRADREVHVGVLVLPDGAVFDAEAGRAVDGKAFACLKGDDLAFKLGDGTPAHAEALALSGAELFDPSGNHRPFKDWVAVPCTHAAQWLRLAESALDGVGATS